MCAAVGGIEAEHASSVALVHGCFGRVGQSADAGLVSVGGHTVDEEIDVGFLAFALALKLNQIILDAHDFTVHLYAGKALLHVDVQLLHQRASFTGDERCQDGESGALREVQHTLHDVFRTMLLHQLSAHG